MMSSGPSSTYSAQETGRMLSLHGARLASFPARAGAFIVDVLFAWLLFLAVLIPGAKLLNNLGFPTGDLNLKFDFIHWYSFAFLVVYFALGTYWGNGRTPGKRLFGIQVVSLVHERMSLWHCVERALGYGASFLEFGFGFAQYFLDPNRRTVHDRIAETIVVSRRTAPPRAT
jgi:uncharacterized RDD family membrane protein YckC